MPLLDDDRCYAAAASRDARFDGHFVMAVRTTGIYCRPSCPAITPKRTNVEFHATAAAAQQRGFRACKRCLPDATPGSPEWNVRRDAVGRAMRLIADGEIERSGVAGLATRLGYSTRHLNRLLTDDLGAGPLAIARAQRAHTARILVETTDMRLTDVAFAAGFGSIRQFNDTMREVYASSPTELRGAARRRPAQQLSIDVSATNLSLRLPYRGPLSTCDLVAWFAARAIDGIEDVTGGHGRGSLRHTRTLRAPHGPAVVTTDFGSTEQPGDGPVITASVSLADPSDLAPVVQRIRRLYDLDADPVAVDAHLATDAVMAPLVARRPGLRSPGSVDAFETAIRAVIGQQISVAGARTVTARLVEALGGEITEGEIAGTTWRTFPTPQDLVDAPDEALPMPAARRSTVRRLAAAVLDGRLELDLGVDTDDARRQLLELRGIGPWTADYVVLRALSDPDVGLTTDLVVARSAEALGITPRCLDQHAARWSPWRSYATHHLWAAAHQPSNPNRRISP